MSTAGIEERGWHRCFDAARDTLSGRPASVQVITADLGAQILSQGRGLLGLPYDPGGRRPDVEGRKHIIQIAGRPRAARVVPRDPAGRAGTGKESRHDPDR